MVTPPLDGLILEGVTRQSILDLAREWGDIKVSERPIYMKELVKLIETHQVKRNDLKIYFFLKCDH